MRSSPRRRPRRWARRRTGPTCCSGWPTGWNAAAACGPRRARRTAWRACWPAAAATPRRLRERVRHLLAAWECRGRRARRRHPQRGAGRRRRGSVGGGCGRAGPGGGRRGPAGRGAHGRLERAGAHAWKARVRDALPEGEARAAELAHELQQLSQRVAEAGATPELVRHADELCQRARRMLAHRQHLLDELGKLCVELTQGLTELAEDDSWARGQCEALQLRLTEGLNVRSVRAASDLLANARKRQAVLRGERNQARDALKELIQGMLTELGEFSEHTGRFHANVGRHAEAISKADSLGGLADVVREMLHDSSEVQALVSADARPAAGRAGPRRRDAAARARARRRTAPAVGRSLHRRADAGGQPARPGPGLRGRARTHGPCAHRPGRVRAGRGADRHRQLQEAQRHARPCRRRRGAAEAGRSRCASSFARATRWRASAARSSSCCCPTATRPKRRRC